MFLPEGWIAVMDPATGSLYYQQPETGTTSWTPPEGSSETPPQAAAAAAPPPTETFAPYAPTQTITRTSFSLLTDCVSVQAAGRGYRYVRICHAAQP